FPGWPRLSGREALLPEECAATPRATALRLRGFCLQEDKSALTIIQNRCIVAATEGGRGGRTAVKGGQSTEERQRPLGRPRSRRRGGVRRRRRKRCICSADEVQAVAAVRRAPLRQPHGLKGRVR